MVNYLLRNETLSFSSGGALDTLLLHNDLGITLHDVRDMSRLDIEAGSVIVIDQSSLSKLDIFSAIEYSEARHPKTLLLVEFKDLENNEFLHLVDDFCVWPVEVAELRVRLEKLSGKKTEPSETSAIRINDLYVDLSRYDVFVGERKVTLTYKEFQLLVSLASNPGHVYSREDLLSKVWGYDYLGGTRTVDVHIRRLRSKIEDAEHVFVETIWNVGYRFNVED